ncbi:MAG: tRNA uridine-5-carboxymethylaminomethyl(34) synthesis GTPase MnmE [Bacillota bacterium]|nr:tRNA uridine-5-carboxymethylaminomethyl(34) synthesis GTPase MnmE [Bacillota bacterium]
MKKQTIAAISTAQGQGGIGIIRISGDEAISVAEKVFRSVSGKPLSTLKGYQAAFGAVFDGDERIDEAVALVFKAPHSYTAEDVVEISCHGGLYMTKRVLRVVLSAGAVLADAGEFTKRAFLNGKLDLTEAEAVIDIISAKGKSAARAALAAKDGVISKKITEFRGSLVEIAAHLSAWADYPDEDIVEVDLDEIKLSVRNAANHLEQLLKSFDNGQIIKEGIDTVIAGRPNVGKSSLMNMLTGSEKSIVTDIEGTTRDIIEETVQVDDLLLRLSDTAGLRETENAIEKIGVDKAWNRIRSAALILLVLDGSSPLQNEDLELINAAFEIPVIAVINKSDLLQKVDEEYINNKIKHIVKISALNQSGLEELLQTIRLVALSPDFDPSQAILLNERQRDVVSRALTALHETLQAIKSGFTLDAVTVSLEVAIENLFELTGERASEAIVNSVFEKFCVGK